MIDVDDGGSGGEDGGDDDDDDGDADSYWSTNIREFKQKKTFYQYPLNEIWHFNKLFYQKS